MATQQAFIADLIKAGATDDEIVKAVQVGQQKGLIDNGGPAAPAQPDGSLMSSAFPRTAALPQDVQNDQGFNGRRFASELGDVFSLPGRGVSALATGAGTLTGGGSLSDAYNAGKQELSQYGPVQGKGALGFAENAIKDPATAATLPIGGFEGGLVKAGLGGLTQGAVSAGMHQAENVSEGKPINVGQAAIETGASGLLGVGGKALGNAYNAVSGDALKDAAARIQGSIVPIGRPEANKGAENALYSVHDVFGDAGQVQQKWQSSIQDLSGQLKQGLEQSSHDPNNYVSTADVFDQAEKNVKTFAKSNVAAAEINGQLQALADKFEASYPSGYMNLLDAQNEKQFIGKSGDWIAHGGSISGDPQAAIAAQAHNALYDALKNQVQDKGGPMVKEVNDQLSEMIPMERAASKQMLVSNRKQIIPFDLYLGGLAALSHASTGNLGPLAMIGARLASKSGTLAQGLNDAGNMINQNPIASGIDNALHSQPVQAATQAATQLGSQVLRSNVFQPQPPPKVKAPQQFKLLGQSDPLLGGTQ